jgi:HEAT repeat protein
VRWHGLDRRRKKAWPIFLDVLEGADPWVADDALVGLGHCGADAKDAVPRLIELLANPYYRARVATCLGEIGPAAKDAVPRLTELANSNDESTAEAAEKALQLILGNNNGK